jgi:hypothetical protein
MRKLSNDSSGLLQSPRFASLVELSTKLSNSMSELKEIEKSIDIYYLNLIRTDPSATRSSSPFDWKNKEGVIQNVQLDISDATYEYIISLETYLGSLDINSASSTRDQASEAYFFVTRNIGNRIPRSMSQDISLFKTAYMNYLSRIRLLYLIVFIGTFGMSLLGMGIGAPVLVKIYSMHNLSLRLFNTIPQEGFHQIIGGLIEFKINYVPQIIDMRSKRELTLQEEEAEIEDLHGSFKMRNSKDNKSKEIIDIGIEDSPKSIKHQKSLKSRSSYKKKNSRPDLNNRKFSILSKKSNLDEMACRAAFHKMLEEQHNQAELHANSGSRNSSPSHGHTLPYRLSVAKLQENAKSGLLQQRKRHNNKIKLIKRVDTVTEEDSKNEEDEEVKHRKKLMRNFKDLKFWPIIKQIIIGAVVFFPWVIFNISTGYSSINSFKGIFAHLEINMQLWQQLSSLKTEAWGVISGTPTLPEEAYVNATSADSAISTITDNLYSLIRDISSEEMNALSDAYSDYKTWIADVRNKDLCASFSFSSKVYYSEGRVFLVI